jgi:hypothetical protein
MKNIKKIYKINDNNILVIFKDGSKKEYEMKKVPKYVKESGIELSTFTPKSEIKKSIKKAIEIDNNRNVVIGYNIFYNTEKAFNEYKSMYTVHKNDEYVEVLLFNGKTGKPMWKKIEPSVIKQYMEKRTKRKIDNAKKLTKALEIINGSNIEDIQELTLNDIKLEGE